MKQLYFYIFSLLVLFMACHDDYEGGRFPSLPGEGEVEVPFNIIMPAQMPKTYALNENDENEVRTVDVLAFKVSGGSETFAYRSQAEQGAIVNTGNGASNKKKFTVKLKKNGSQTYRFVVLANAKEYLDNYTGGSIVEGASKEEVLKQIMLAKESKWNTDNTSPAYQPIPMWGETTNNVVIQDGTTITGLLMVRMLAKINIQIDPTISHDYFKLTGVFVYNYYTKGYLAPNKNNLEPGSRSRVVKPSVTGLPINKGPLAYDESGIFNQNAIKNSIYMFESEVPKNADGVDLDKVTCLVIGGKYNGASNVSYYRLDIVKDKQHLDILRNHLYNINIKKVKSAGYASKEDAFNSRAVNIEAEVVEWDEADISDVVFDGQYMMAVSQSDFALSQEERIKLSSDNEFVVTTDYPTGWKIAKIVDDQDQAIDWLSTDITSGESNVSSKVKIIVPLNDSRANRTGYIHIAAGRLRYIVKVTQSLVPGLGITFFDAQGKMIEGMEFVAEPGIQPDERKFKMVWEPASSEVFYTSNIIKNRFLFDGSLGYDVIAPSGTLIDQNGSIEYTIRPELISQETINSDPFFERTTVMLYSVSNGVELMNKSFMLRQYVYNIVPYPDPVYLMDGGEKYVTVKSNIPFNVTVSGGNNDNIIQLITQSGGANTAEGTKVYFNIIDDLANPRLYNKEVQLTFSSPEGKVADKTITLKCASGIVQSEANSYMVKPDGVGILIPVSRANQSELGTQLNEEDEFVSELIWTDNRLGVKDNSNIRMIRSVGTGSKGYILVMPGAAEGNALVAVKKDGKILWSWHIWVTNYVPEPTSIGRFMTRNLGALSEMAGEPKTMGFLYQWGRKDPIVGADVFPEINISSVTEQKLYDEKGDIFYPEVVKGGSFESSVRNPTTMYYRGSARGLNDWYISVSGEHTRNDDLWGHISKKKSVYDPCPPGWTVPYDDTAWSGPYYWDDVIFGFRIKEVDGFYPAAGVRGNANGKLTEVGRNGNYWLSIPNTSNGSAHMYRWSRSESGLKFREYTRTTAASVRCVKDVNRKP